MMRYDLECSWEITGDGLEMTRDELIAEATAPGGPLAAALIGHEVTVTGDARWEVDTTTEPPRLRVTVPVTLWAIPRELLPAARSVRAVAARDLVATVVAAITGEDVAA